MVIVFRGRNRHRGVLQDVVQMATGARYVYCAWDGRRWELLKDGDAVTALTPSALYHLLSTGAVHGNQEIRLEGEKTSSPVSQQREVLKRTAYGQTLPVLFAQKDVFWYYKGMSDSIVGPLDGHQMLSWFHGGYLYEKMMVSTQKDITCSPPSSEFSSLQAQDTTFSENRLRGHLRICYAS